MNRLEQLQDAGVSIWLDTLSRELLDSGAFAGLIADSAVTGATSNPTIFAKAITRSDRYDDQLRAAGGRDPRELFFELALEDVRHAADLLRPTYEASGGRDGFVSFECTPDLADDTDGTVEQAVELWSRLARDNVMIKVPATEAGVPAIEELTARGINVNVTLLFSVARYEQVIDAYLAGLERRASRGDPIDAIASVASFFVSRVDTKADALLPAGSALRGRIAIANARLAYARYRDRFSDRRWLALRDAGAHPQRPLWASTATKDPAYSDVLYVEQLVAADAINTMPEATLRAFADHGDASRALDPSSTEPEETLSRAADAGVDLAAVTAELEQEGVRSFCDSYRDLLACIETKLQRTVTDGLATERWINEGGRLAPEAVIERELRASGPGRRRGRARPRVLIAGGGVAGLETLLALRALAGDRIDITLVAPELRFVNRSMAVDQPFRPQRVRGVRMRDVTAEHRAGWLQDVVDRVEHERRVVVTKAGHELPYEVLVLAVGARPEREWHADGVLTFHDGRDGPAYRLLLHQLREGRVDTLAFVKPTGASWPLPLYDLALMTAAAAHHRPEVELCLVTPEEAPLGMFGAPASAAVARLLDESGVSVHTSSVGVPGRPGWLDIRPGDRRLSVDRIVTEPRLAGPRLRGIPCGRDGFIHTDPHGRVVGLDGVYAAGDATDFPVKQGGLATQQADAVAEAIAASVGADIEPQPFRPVLRGVLLTGAAPLYLRADISGCAGDDSTISSRAQWWPPNKLSGRYLAPYLSRQTGEAADVMPAPGPRPGVAERPLERSAS